MIFDTSF